MILNPGVKSTFKRHILKLNSLGLRFKIPRGLRDLLCESLARNLEGNAIIQLSIEMSLPKPKKRFLPP